MKILRVRKARSKNVLLFPLFILTLLLVSYRYFFPSSALAEHYSSYVMYPLLVVQNKVVKPIKLFFERQKTVEELTTLVRSLQKEKEELIAQAVSLYATAYYAHQTKELADFRDRYQVPEAYLAHVMLRQFSDQSHFMLIDRGSRKGIKQNMVAVFKNCLVGRVSEVYPFYSKVLLITDKTCKIAAICGNTKSCGIHEGRNEKESCSLSYVSHLCALEQKDLLFSSGEGLIFPQGFGIGRIKSFERTGLFYDVHVEPLIDLKNIEYVYIMQKGEL